MTGAAFGMKSERKRNFEAGILIDDSTLVNSAIEQFDKVWIGRSNRQARESVDISRLSVVTSRILLRDIYLIFIVIIKPVC